MTRTLRRRPEPVETLLISLAMLLAFACAFAEADELATDQVARPSAKVIRVGPRHSVTTVAEAARIAQDGDVVEIEAGVFTDDVASWPQDDLTIRAIGGRARMVSRGASAEGKAIWVIKGNRVVIENIEFAGMQVADRNGAGIRFEGGKLTVRNCLFERNQMGLLTWNNEQAELTVENSEFRDNAVASTHRPGEPVGHQIYVGAIARFTLRESYVHRGAFGHLVKSRARENHIINNRITDESNGRSSYELEFPNGGISYVLGNIIQQGAQTENLAVISYGAEGYRWPTNELYLVNNTLVDDSHGGGTFLRARFGRIVASNNLLLGNATLDSQPHWEMASNVVARDADVVSVANGDYRLRAASPLVGKTVDPGSVNGVSLRLDREYVDPLQGRPVPAGPLNPGALQSVAR